MDEQKKTKILWLRQLLKTNAPLVYDRYKGYKLNKEPKKEIKPIQEPQNKVPSNGLSEETLKGAARFQKWMDEEEVRMKNTI